MTTSTTGPDLTENLEPLARIVERLLVLTERSRSTALIHAALQDALQSAHDGEDDTPHWMRVLQRALQALGVRASRMKMPASSAMSTVGPQQPVALS